MFVHEDMASQIDGATDTFTVSKGYRPASVLAFYNGIAQFCDVTLVPPTSVQLPFIPSPKDTLKIRYRPL